ncbi:hypothetical protein BROUX41_001639 [Berkeleyomyces rouxiae]|uniref:uncharacterized protein n=1 Tax=Berkeleyomyces rouxiae TaxID=2035830 RepID=UPI003B8122B0
MNRVNKGMTGVRCLKRRTKKWWEIKEITLAEANKIVAEGGFSTDNVSQNASPIKIHINGHSEEKARRKEAVHLKRQATRESGLSYHTQGVASSVM